MTAMPSIAQSVAENVAAGLIVAGLGAVGAGIIKARGDPVESVTSALIALAPSFFVGCLWTLGALIPFLGLTQMSPPLLSRELVGALGAACVAVFTIICVWHTARSRRLFASLSNVIWGSIASFWLGLLVFALQLGGAFVLLRVASGTGLAMWWLILLAVIHSLLLLRLCWRIGEWSQILDGERNLSARELGLVYLVGRRITP